MRDPHDDFLGQRLAIDDIIVGSNGFDALTFFKVIAFSTKMVRVVRLMAKRPNPGGRLVYGKTLLKIGPEQVTMYMLKCGDET